MEDTGWTYSLVEQKGNDEIHPVQWGRSGRRNRSVIHPLILCGTHSHYLIHCDTYRYSATRHTSCHIHQRHTIAAKLRFYIHLSHYLIHCIHSLIIHHNVYQKNRRSITHTSLLITHPYPHIYTKDSHSDTTRYITFILPPLHPALHCLHKQISEADPALVASLPKPPSVSLPIRVTVRARLSNPSMHQAIHPRRADSKACQ